MRRVTAIGGFERYDQLFKLVSKVQGRGVEGADFVVSVRTVMEFVGITQPKATCIKANQDLERQILIHPALGGDGLVKGDAEKEAKADIFGLADRLIEDLHTRLYEYFSVMPELSKANFQAKLEEQLEYVDPRMRNTVVRQNFETAILRDDFENAVWTSLALDRLFAYNPPHALHRFIHSVAQVRYSDFLRDGYNIPLGRVGQTIWTNFSDLIRRRTEAREVTGSAPTEEILRNIRLAQKLCKMDSIGEQLDYELVHYAVMGRIEQDRALPVLGVTMDNHDQIRMRVALYKSFIRHLQEMVPVTAAGRMVDSAPGLILIVDANMREVARIEVRKTNCLFEALGKGCIVERYGLDPNLLLMSL